MSDIEITTGKNPFAFDLLEFLQGIEEGGISLTTEAQRLAVAMIMATEDEMTDNEMTCFLSLFMLTTQEFKAFKKQMKPDARLKYNLAKMRMDAFDKGFETATILATENMESIRERS